MGANDGIPTPRRAESGTESLDSVVCEFSDADLSPDTTPRPVSPDYLRRMPLAALRQFPDHVLRKYLPADLLRQVRPDLAPPESSS